ncbi:LuxR C-terminal-related transcriptional regulator [Sorangium sp. So ce134]
MLQRSKLYAPAPRDGTVARPRLLEKLDDVRGGLTALIVAPAGYGKTTLVSQWLSERPAPHAWLTLDRADGDLGRCARYLCAALARLAPELAALQAALDAGGLGAREIAEALVAELRALEAPATLVLDDVHALDEASASHALLAHLAEHAPGALSIVVTSRSIPPWPCARLRARGQLVEITAEALRFSAGEASALFSKRGLSVSRSTAGKLAERTEGWAVGLALSALLLGRGDPASDLLARFGGTHRWVADYLVEEVLAKEDGRVRDFLLHSAALPRLSDALCAAAGLGDAGVRVAELHARGLFVSELDGERRWFRYHDLFRELLLERARSLASERVRDVTLRAAAWFRDQGDPEAAIELWLAAGEHAEAAALIERHARARLLSGEFPPLRGWLDAIPEPVRARHPRLLTLDAWTLADAERARRAEPMLDRADALLAEARERDRGAVGEAHRAMGVESEEIRDQLRSEIAMMRSFFARMRRDFQGASRLSREALELARDGGIPVRARAATGLGQDAYMRGDFREARVQLEQALAVALEEGELVSIVMAVGYLIQVLHCAGELELALRMGQRVGAWLERRKLSRVAAAKWQRGALVCVLIEKNQLDRAAEALEPLLGLDYGAPLQQIVVQGFRFMLARARRDLDEAELALDAVDEVRRRAITRYSFGWADTPALKADLALWRGDDERALGWLAAYGAEASPPADFLGEADFEIAARIDAWAGDPGRGAARAVALAERAWPAARITRGVGARVMAAHASLRQRDRAQAKAHLKEALLEAHGRGLHRSVLDALPDVSDVLRLASEERIVPEITRKLVAELGGAPERLRVSVEGLREPLRPRELQVLRLLADGLSNEELAGRLGIQVSTVKVHLRGLYAKLGARSRARALARARELGLRF